MLWFFGTLLNQFGKLSPLDFLAWSYSIIPSINAWRRSQFTIFTSPAPSVTKSHTESGFYFLLNEKTPEQVKWMISTNLLHKPPNWQLYQCQYLTNYWHVIFSVHVSLISSSISLIQKLLQRADTHTQSTRIHTYVHKYIQTKAYRQKHINTYNVNVIRIITN